jgi:hypothetical protein
MTNAETELWLATKANFPQGSTVIEMGRELTANGDPATSASTPFPGLIA